MSRRQRRTDLVELRHPDVRAAYRAPVSTVPFWEAQGWSRTDRPEATARSLSTKSKTTTKNKEG